MLRCRTLRSNNGPAMWIPLPVEQALQTTWQTLHARLDNLNHSGAHQISWEVNLHCAQPPFADVLHQLQAEFHDAFCDDLGDVWNFPAISKTKSSIQFEINLKQGATLHHSPPYCVPEALLPCFHEMLLEHLNAGYLHYLCPPWASLAFLVSKGNGKFCMVCKLSSSQQCHDSWSTAWEASRTSYILLHRKGRYLPSWTARMPSSRCLWMRMTFPRQLLLLPLSCWNGLLCLTASAMCHLSAFSQCLNLASSHMASGCVSALHMAPMWLPAMHGFFPFLFFFPCHPKYPEIYLDCKSF